MAALEQEIASVIRFILDSVPGITPYYWDIPEGFVVPSVFFPQPELTPLGDTFASYVVEYDWYIQFFASTDEDAYASAAAAFAQPACWFRSLTRREQRQEAEYGSKTPEE